MTKKEVIVDQIQKKVSWVKPVVNYELLYELHKVLIKIKNKM